MNYSDIIFNLLHLLRSSGKRLGIKDTDFMDAPELLEQIEKEDQELYQLLVDYMENEIETNLNQIHDSILHELGYENADLAKKSVRFKKDKIRLRDLIIERLSNTNIRKSYEQRKV